MTAGGLSGCRRPLAALAILALTACRPSLPLVPRDYGHCAEPAAVPYPPPPARVQVVEDRPTEDSRWIDGAWTWTGTTYTWTDGRWIRYEPGWFYTPPKTIRDAEGELVYCAARWHKLQIP